MKRIINYPLLAIAMVIAALSAALTAAADTPTTLYILGQVNQNTWSPNQGVPMTRNDDGTFTADVYCKNETNDFSFAIELNSSWSYLNENGGWRRYGANIADENYWPITTNADGTSRFYFISKGRVRSANAGKTPLYLTYEQISPVITENPRDDMSEALNAGEVLRDRESGYRQLHRPASPGLRASHLPPAYILLPFHGIN